MVGQVARQQTRCDWTKVGTDLGHTEPDGLLILRQPLAQHRKTSRKNTTLHDAEQDTGHREYDDTGICRQRRDQIDQSWS